MDWSKAKNILILAFIITNIFLIYHIGMDIFYSDELRLISDEYIDYVENELTRHGITVKDEIPKEIFTMPVLVVKYELFDHEATALQLLGEGYRRVDENIYENDHAQLIIESNKRLKYSLTDNTVVDYRIDDEKAVEISNEFLKEHNLYRNDITLKQVYLGTEKAYGDTPLYKLVYNQTYKGKFLGESYINVYVNHKGVVGMEAMLLKPDKTQNQKERTIPATEALLRKMSHIVNDHKEDVVISDIEIGYYFNPNDVQFSTWQQIEWATAFPAWKITLKNGKSYYVDALKN
ncbi:two-component system regulatory protein YycI [Alkaliphilus crotonatoxidans]